MPASRRLCPTRCKRFWPGWQREPLPLDAARDEWLARLRNWLGVTP